MILRYLSSATVGAAATAVILFLMQLLIEIGPEVVVDTRERHELAFVRVPVNEEITDMAPPPPIPRPQPLPETKPQNQYPGPTTPIHVPKTGPGEPSRPTGLELGVPDGALVIIIRVQPNYPASAITRELEGYVTVRFDVSAMGLVENVEVIDSSHSVFEEEAVKAAYRFRYRARVVDGVAQPTAGLRFRFTFQMEQ
jgi:protein TonB